MAAVFESIESEPVFASASQAVHVAFLVMSEEATQEAPFRKALIRAMESIQLTNNQRNWLDELRGAKSGDSTVNFGGLSGPEVRAQCVMILEAVKHRLTGPEMWLLQAKYGNIDYEDVHLGMVPLDLQLPVPPAPSRRYAFPAERIEAIKQLSEWLAPSFPKLKPLAIDLMLARMFAKHKKIEISSRDLAKSFGGNHTMYLRATRKMTVMLRRLEYVAMDRLEEYFAGQGVTPVADGDSPR